MRATRKNEHLRPPEENRPGAVELGLRGTHGECTVNLMSATKLALEVRGPVTVVACDCCGRFCSAEGGTVLHATHCDGGKRSERFVPLSVAEASLEIGRSVPLNAVGNGEAEDVFHAIHSTNHRDWNRAMNRDD
jgi:hypothetical protein